MRTCAAALALLAMLVAPLLADAPPAADQAPAGRVAKPAPKKKPDPAVLNAALAAVQSGDLAGVEQALAAEPGLVQHTDRLGRTLLQYAVIYSHPDIVDLLIRAGADPRQKDANGEPVLLLPLYGPSTADMNGMIRLLLAGGADAKQTDRRRRSVLHRLPVLRLNAETILLLAAAADVNAKDETGATPLHVLADCKTLPPSGRTRVAPAAVAALLLDQGADPNARDKRGATPLHRAVAAGHADMVACLAAHKANLLAKDSDGLTPYAIALSNQNAELVAFLKEHKADRDSDAAKPAPPAKKADRKGKAR